LAAGFFADDFGVLLAADFAAGFAAFFGFVAAILRFSFDSE
jgi:hypothetical protein